MIIKYILDHSWLLALLGVPALLAAVPTLVRRATINGLHKIIEAGEFPEDDELIRAIVAALVKWAEAKYKAGRGPLKYEAVDTLAAKALPFMGAEDRRKLIEEAVKQLDAGAHEASDAPAAPQQ